MIEPEGSSSQFSSEDTSQSNVTSAFVPTAAAAFTSPLPAVSVAAEDTAASLSAQINGLLAANLDEQDDSKIVAQSQMSQLEAKNRELETRLEQYAVSLKQYEEYAQNLVKKLYVRVLMS